MRRSRAAAPRLGLRPWFRPFSRVSDDRRAGEGAAPHPDRVMPRRGPAGLVPVEVATSTMLAEAKLVAPRSRAGLVDRPRILGTLDGGEGTAVALVAAPAGYGKTTAVRAWCESRGAALAWVTLDAGDNDPARLWLYVATDVDRVRQGLGRGALHGLNGRRAYVERSVDELANGMAAFGEELVVVLDNLQSVTDRVCLASLDHAVERLPPAARV